MPDPTPTPLADWLAGDDGEPCGDADCEYCEAGAVVREGGDE